ncbi:exopolysaccharide biosynthesis polyprenyl glycosylphosphotransferase [Edaphobacter dinghuensis]|uniref:exopolysaccharide biosynthesis polyprenyl glycosylphosphotransferase n=1 Tax=Edaphobacter dinghuensis TaxID=1560005 RepID=UPI001662FAF5|nr:exopolysaccharide biosynthesis polyprenyl glycosylphosphotransferase [Edaphobacter dinghuensis]
MGASESVTSRLYAETLAASGRELRATLRYLFQNTLAAIEMASDFLTCIVGILAAYFFESSLYVGRQLPYPIREAAAVSLSVSLFSVLLLHRDGAYRGSGGLLQIRETERAIRVPVQSVLIMLPFSLLLNLKFSWLDFTIALVLIPVLLILQKHAFAAVISVLRVRGRGTDRVIVYGIGETGKRVLSALSCSFRLGLYPVAMIDDNPVLDGEWMSEMGYRRRRSVPVQRGPITSALLTSCQCSTLIVVLPNLSSEQIAAAADAAIQAGSRVFFLSATELREQKWTESIDVDGLLLTPMLESFERWPYSVAKRIVDLIGASLLLVLLAPLFFLIAFFIKLDSSGSAFFVQDRVGRNGELFKMYKFRSMYKGTPQYELSPTTPFDPRITRIGRFLRKTSLDELPQLMNVFLGDMSLVGPRPEMPFIVQIYTSEQRQRLQVVPGITGLWQLSADRAFLIHENIQYDLYYIRNRGFFMDIAILIHTLFFTMRRGV